MQITHTNRSTLVKRPFSAQAIEREFGRFLGSTVIEKIPEPLMPFQSSYSPGDLFVLFDSSRKDLSLLLSLWLLQGGSLGLGFCGFRVWKYAFCGFGIHLKYVSGRLIWSVFR